MVPRASSRARNRALIILSAAFAIACPINAQPSGRSTRISLSDSLTVLIHLGAADTAIFAYTPEGVFRLHADSSALASWGRASAALPGPKLRPGSGSNGPMDFSASVLKASNESGNAMRLVRLTGDPLSAYALTASNGAWDGGGRIPPEMVSVLFRALSGSEGEGVKWESDKFRGDSVEPGFKAAEPAPGNPGPHYPARAELGRAAGEVVTQFTIGPDGRARPESLLIMRSTHPLFSLAVREALPSMRFLPATRLGIPVETSVIQQFQFKLP